MSWLRKQFGAAQIAPSPKNSWLFGRQASAPTPQPAAGTYNITPAQQQLQNVVAAQRVRHWWSLFHGEATGVSFGGAPTAHLRAGGGGGGGSRSGGSHGHHHHHHRQQQQQQDQSGGGSGGGDSGGGSSGGSDSGSADNGSPPAVNVTVSPTGAPAQSAADTGGGESDIGYEHPTYGAGDQGTSFDPQPGLDPFWNAAFGSEGPSFGGGPQFGFGEEEQTDEEAQYDLEHGIITGGTEGDIDEMIANGLFDEDPFGPPEQVPTLRNAKFEFGGDIYSGFGAAPIIGCDTPGRHGVKG